MAAKSDITGWLGGILFELFEFKSWMKIAKMTEESDMTGGGFIWIVWILAPGHFSSPGNYIWVVADKEKRERFAETAFHHIKNQAD